MLFSAFHQIHAETVPVELLGDWSLDLESGDPAWMSVGEKEVHLRVHVGPIGPYPIERIENGRVHFSRKSRGMKEGKRITVPSAVSIGMKEGKLDGAIVRPVNHGVEKEIARFTGKSIPPLPKSAPDLSKVHFGHPISLFNGKDLTGWRPHETDKKFGWAAKDGLLVNETPKTDFSATGDHANLRTDAEFEDFWLHIEFLIEAQRNSGVYLRGMYEAQVVDRDSRMQGLQGAGSIFGRIAPSVNAAKLPGEWNVYDITLVNRHVTVVLNGVKVIDNQPVAGPTGGAIHTDPMSPGPIHLQGDHTAVKYRNIYLAPVVDAK